MKLQTALDSTEWGSLSRASSLAYRRRLTKLFGLVDDLREYKETVERLRADVKNNNVRKDLFGVVLAVGKRNPEFKRWVGEEALEAYLVALKEGNERSQKDMEKKTADPAATVPHIDKLMGKLSEISDKYGAHSKLFLAAYLQVNIIGLRDDLGGVRVTTRDRAIEGKWYNKRNGRLVIADFKTAKTHDPYDLKLEKGVRDVIAASLRKDPERKWLINSSAGVGDLVRKAFAGVGMKVGINTIRHSQASALIGENPTSIPHVQKVAMRFKHSEETSRRYFRPTE